MNAKLVKLLLPCAAIGAIAIGPAALAQAPAPPPAPPAVAPPPAPPAGNSNQLLETRGTVQRFTLTPIGELDGVILTDGTEVHLPPHLTTQLASAVRIGDTVAVQGNRSPSVSLIVASSITDTNTSQTVVDNGPPPPGFRPPPPPPGMPAPGAQQASVQGKVRASACWSRRSMSTAPCSRTAPRPCASATREKAYQVATLLTPGQILTVQGWALTTAYGRVIDTQAVGPSPNQLTQVAPRPPQGPAPPPR